MALSHASQSSTGTERSQGDEFERAAAPEGARGKKRELRGWHAPWDTSPAHVLDLSKGRSKVNDKSLEELWAYFASSTEILKWRTEWRFSVSLWLALSS